MQEHENRNIGFINTTDMMGMSLLHFAAMNKKSNNADILKMLLQKNPNVNSIARDNTTPLDFAATTGEYEQHYVWFEHISIFHWKH